MNVRRVFACVCVRACSSRTQEIYTTWSKLKIPGRENYLEAEASEGAPKEKNTQKKRKQRVEKSEIDYKTTSQNTIIRSLELRKPAEPNLANKYTYYSKENRV